MSWFRSRLRQWLGIAQQEQVIRQLVSRVLACQEQDKQEASILQSVQVELGRIRTELADLSAAPPPEKLEEPKQLSLVLASDILAKVKDLRSTEDQT